MQFNGEYLKGKRNGKGREYNYQNKLIYEGEYLEGEQKPKDFDEDCINQ